MVYNLCSCLNTPERILALLVKNKDTCIEIIMYINLPFESYKRLFIGPHSLFTSSNNKNIQQFNQ